MKTKVFYQVVETYSYPNDSACGYDSSYHTLGFFDSIELATKEAEVNKAKELTESLFEDNSEGFCHTYEGYEVKEIELNKVRV